VVNSAVPDELTRQLYIEYGVNPDDLDDEQAFLDEMDSIKTVLDVLAYKIDAITASGPLQLIAYLPIRDFWYGAFGSKQIVSLHRLQEALMDYAKTRKYNY
jgi:hypothetical protein